MRVAPKKQKKMTLIERMEWAAGHGACDPECQGRCVVCPAEALREGINMIEILEEQLRAEQELK